MNKYKNLKSNNIKKIILISMLVIFLIVISSSNSKAATLQSNPNTQYTTTDMPTNWIKNIREMETTGGAMGLDETLNSDLTSTTNNGIDVHMIKSTEYGATAILSASGYGNPDTLQNSSIKTTTGNKTGIYYNGTSWENVAGNLSGCGFTSPAYNPRYYDNYGEVKVGDALTSCANWHGSSTKDWLVSSIAYGSIITSYWLRGGDGLFGYTSMYYGGDWWGHPVTNNSEYYTHAIATCGAGV